MNNQIDLSKAYAGQIITLQNGTVHEIDNIHLDSNGYYDIDDYGYYKNGKFTGDSGGDIISIEDPIQVQVARIEGVIKGIELALDCAPLNEWSKVYAERTVLIEKLKRLTNESNN
jgi:hypothetical protein